MSTRNHLQIFDRDYFIHSEPIGDKKYEEGRFVKWENPRTTVTNITFMVELGQTGKFIEVTIDPQSFSQIAAKIVEIRKIPVTVEFLTEYKSDF